MRQPPLGGCFCHYLRVYRDLSTRGDRDVLVEFPETFDETIQDVALTFSVTFHF